MLAPLFCQVILHSVIMISKSIDHKKKDKHARTLLTLLSMILTRDTINISHTTINFQLCPNKRVQISGATLLLCSSLEGLFLQT